MRGSGESAHPDPGPQKVLHEVAAHGARGTGDQGDTGGGADGFGVRHIDSLTRIAAGSLT